MSTSSAIIPLTVFDRVFERSAFVTGWLVEGTVDVNAVSAALKRVTDKWRLLAGRLDSINEGKTTRWLLKVPLGPIASDYPTFALTTSTSDVPITHFVPVPIPYSSPSLPHSLFIHPDTPRQYASWKTKDYPLTCWHITHFPALPQTGQSYSCIGFARCHGFFDGVGAAMIVKALISELTGQTWSIPSLPPPGLNVNPVEEILKRLASDHLDTRELKDGSGYSNVGILGALKVLASHTRERWWNNAERRIFIIPAPVFSRFLQSVRSTLSPRSDKSEHISSGDIMAAWLMKTIYAQGTVDSTTVHCTNFASFRDVLASSDDTVLQYPHNAFIPLPYPVYSVHDLKTAPFPKIIRQMSAARKTLSTKHVVGGYLQMVDNPLSIPAHPTAQEAFLLSNVSASRILEVDWTSVGGTKTLCGYRYSMTPTQLILTNSVYISGRLADGSLVLDTTLNELRRELLQSEIWEMIAQYNASQWLGETSK